MNEIETPKVSTGKRGRPRKVATPSEPVIETAAAIEDVTPKETIKVTKKAVEEKKVMNNSRTSVASRFSDDIEFGTGLRNAGIDW